MGDFCDNLIKNNPGVVCLYFGAVLVLLVLIIMQLWQVGVYQQEHNKDGAQVWGKDAARNTYAQNNSSFQSVDSGSNRGENRSSQGEDTLVGLARGSSQHLVNNRGEPDFWTIGSELGAYRRAQSGQAPTYAKQDKALASAGAVGAGERFTSLGRNQHAVPGFIGRNVVEHMDATERAMMGL